MANTAGDAVIQTMQVDDGTGITVTIAAAGTFVPLTHATLITAGNVADDSGGVTKSLTAGSLTIASKAAVGAVKLRAWVSGTGANAATVKMAWHRTRAGVKTKLGAAAQIKAAATAVIQQICHDAVDVAQLSDIYTLEFDSSTNADTFIVKAAHLEIQKVRSGL